MTSWDLVHTNAPTFHNPPWTWGQQIPPKCWYPSNKVQGITTWHIVLPLLISHNIFTWESWHFIFYSLFYPVAVGRDSCRYSDSLQAGRSGDRIPVGVRFSAPVQTGPRASRTMGTGSFPGVKQPGRGVDHPPPSIAEVKERVELYLYSHSGPSWPVLGWTLLY
jgi:hypothetical protein